MSEKKKVAVVTSAEETQQQPTGGQAFNFQSFQEQFYQNPGEAGPTSKAPPQPEEEGGSGYHTVYQARKTSIVEGMSATELVDEHRKSIACVTAKEIGKTVDLTDLGGITLSKRHMMDKMEYEADMDAGAYGNLNGYAFGNAADPADK